MTEVELIKALPVAGHPPITGITFNNDVILSGNVIGKKQIIDCEFKKIISCHKFNISEDLNFSNCTFDVIELISCSGNALHFDNCTFHETVTFAHSNNNRIWFNGCIFEKAVSILHGEERLEFQISKSPTRNSHLKEGIRFHGNKIQYLNIRDTTIEGNLDFDNVSIGSIFIADGIYHAIRFSNQKKLNKLTIQGDTDDRKMLLIKNFHAPSLGIGAVGNLLFQNATIEKMDLTFLSQNEGKFRMQNVKLSQQFIIRESDLGRIVFNEVDFDGAKISFDNSYIGKCIFSNVKWPIKKRMYSFKEIEGRSVENELKNTLILKEVYRQLKDVSKSQSSNIDALDFYRNEMAEYWKEIRQDNSVTDLDKFIVWTSKVSSDFGLSLYRPLVGLFIFHSLLFFLLTLSNYENYQINLCDISWSNTLNGLGAYFYLLNPAHKFIDNEGGLVQIIDVFIRLFSGFFIYHIIRATRKHSKL